MGTPTGYTGNDFPIIAIGGAEKDYNGEKSLADSTHFVLLDNNNNADKEYYINMSDISTESTSARTKYEVIDFADITTTRNKAEVTDETKFKVQTLNDIAVKKIRYEEDSAQGQYLMCEENDNDAVAYAYNSDTKNYFKPYKQGDSGQRYKLTASEDIIETYYLSMFTYEADNTITDQTHDAYSFTVKCPTTFTSNVITCHKSLEKPTEIYLGNYLAQTLEIRNVNPNESMSATNSMLYATITSTLTFTGKDAKYYYDRLLNEKLYQGFFLYLKTYDKDGRLLSDESDIKGEPYYDYTTKVNGTDYEVLSAPDTVDEGAPYIYIPPVEITIENSGGQDGSTWKSVQQALINVDYRGSETKLAKEFPIRNTATNILEGVRLDAQARIDFVKDRVKYSNNIIELLPNQRPTQKYHIDKISDNGVLTLTALDQPTVLGFIFF